jgi:hypothetical protein
MAIGRAAQKRDEVAPLHCLMLPVLSTERIAHLATAQGRCAAGFRSSLCPVWVLAVLKRFPVIKRSVRPWALAGATRSGETASRAQHRNHQLGYFGLRRVEHREIRTHR